MHFGGSGTRLWPLSRENFPKRYLIKFPKFILILNFRN
ncbi:sugar phosphate nucleotidyltransferase [uncultured Prochlorococcus sp.]|nr:sugar phosphate nucleotidyltransferase [uncultured Prochlorococcus sp.]